MQSLPTPVQSENLHSMLDMMETLPSAEVSRHADVVTVTATKKTTGERVTVLRAVTHDLQNWHVMAAPGLVLAINQ